MLAVVRQEVARREARALDGRAPHAGDGREEHDVRDGA